jgi:hypothetical protein
MKIHATVNTNGFISNQTIMWLLRNNIKFTLFEVKPREASKMACLNAFLQSDADYWLLMNNYANPQFSVKDIKFKHPVMSALMNKNNNGKITPIIGNQVNKINDRYLKSEFIPTGFLLLKRAVVEQIKNKRPFEYKHDVQGNCIASGDKTLSDILLKLKHSLIIDTKLKVVNRQEMFI